MKALILISFVLSACGTVTTTEFTQNLSVLNAPHPKLTPLVADITQGSFNDCWLLASLATFAAKNPNVLVDAIVLEQNGNWIINGQTVNPTHPLQNGNLDLTPYQINWPAAFEGAYRGNLNDEFVGPRAAAPLLNVEADVQFFAGINPAEPYQVVCTLFSEAILVPSHCYAVINETTLYNPWGGALENPYVSVPATRLFASVTSFKL